MSKGLTTTDDLDEEAKMKVYELFKNDEDEIENLLGEQTEDKEIADQLNRHESKSSVSKVINRLEKISSSFRYDIKMPK